MDEKVETLQSQTETAGDDVPPAQVHFTALNAELSKAWKVITERKPAPPDADEWKDVEQKLHLLDRGDA